MEARCITYDTYGKPCDVLQLEYKRIEPPKDHELLVRMLTRPINPSDVIPIYGAYAHRSALPAIPGYEGVGVVEDVGARVSKQWIGQRVLPLCGEGTWQDFVRCPSHWAVAVPDVVSNTVAAQAYINPVTAWLICTEKLALQPNDVLLVNACSSAIGHLFAQLATIIGFKLIAVTRHSRHTDLLLRLGANVVIDTSKGSMYEAVMKHTNGRGADAAIDLVGGSAGNALAFSVRPGGRYLAIGLLSGQPVNWADIQTKARVQQSIFHLRHWQHRVSVERWHATFDSLMRLIAEGRLQFKGSGAQFNLYDVAQAIRAFENPETNRKGKVFLQG
ncbi:zinc-dependent alcohol dehydrogenase family protein [Bacillaceae bacterium SIJ1]|uniref:zinc-dependent alcohol dehydrogenase family protein n=1 Tax=Litoribacterium kuwaitense TaxID=1398745 RepID=UPI0013EE085E|nr:zinc-dependent alcohol dehydrogenase family protein [Litoribacterium kuwaitense]NGP46801.1 zinc-dependent alcohol dehydrogenase family protein [Litoribacterium kuwaitense]